jgi:membrane protease YdiL (CAAX protease family)
MGVSRDMKTSVKTSWPWVTMLLAAAVALNPVGLDFLYSAFMSNEQLSRNIAQPIVFMIGGALGALIVLEFILRKYLMRRRQSASGALHG